MVLAAPWALLLNIWWLVPFAHSYLGGGGAVANADFTDPTNWSWSQAQNKLPNILTMVANWAWVRPQYLPFAAGLDQPWIVWIRYLIPALVFLAPVLAIRRLRRAALVLLGLVAGLRGPRQGPAAAVQQIQPASCTTTSRASGSSASP